LNEKKIILAIETSGKTCSISLASFDFCSNFTAKNCSILGEYNIFESNKHDKFTAEFCRRIIEDNELNFKDLAAVAISIGPGSFTGLRIGTSVAKGLCFDDSFLDNSENNSEKAINNVNKNIKIIAVPTLDTIANNANNFINSLKSINYKNEQENNFEILAIIPSHSNFVYHQLFNEKNEKMSEISLSEIEVLNENYSEKENLFLASNQKIDFEILNFSEKLSEKIKLFPELFQINASIIAKFAVKMFEKNLFANSEDLIPLYVQEFVPKTNK
jgi:tRNA threonylcarbamoyl adenosine modification protein YeaZ